MCLNFLIITLVRHFTDFQQQHKFVARTLEKPL